MPKLVETPALLRPYLFHGVNLSWGDPKGQAAGDCPFCGREGKFSVAADTGLWRCYVCGEGSAKGGGNVFTFLQLLWDASDRATKDYKALARDRGLLYEETPMLWGAAQSVITGDWILPGFNLDRKIVQLYRYAPVTAGGKRILLATPGLNHGLFGLAHWDPKKPTAYVCEGPWDGMALWESLRGAKAGEGSQLEPTAEESVSLYAAANVVAAPGCNVFPETWAPLFTGKVVTFLYDNDHPREHPPGSGKFTQAGYDGMKRAAGILSRTEEGPSEVRYLRWGKDGHDPNLSDGYDVRNQLDSPTPELRINQLASLLSRVQPIPTDWIAGRSRVSKKGGVDVDCLPCDSWRTLINSWKKALRWTEGLDRALGCMLAACLSTESVGDQLWMKIIGPAACGKSTLCEALSVNKKYVLAKSTIRGFHSGFQADRQGTDDSSLLSLLKNKTLVTKDGDTLLQAPNLGQILAEARDVYDRTSRTHYRNKMSRDYEGVSMTWLLCGTESLRSLDSSELGERFLDCVIIDEIDEDEEDEIGWRVANRADREMCFRADGRVESRDGPEMVEAKRLTGGYVGHLRSNAQELLSAVDAPEEALKTCQRLAKFVSYMRARPSRKQEEKVQREMSYRLISQLVRLGKALAVVLNQTTLTEEVMRRVKRVALDTARGRTLDIARQLYRCSLTPPHGVESSALAVLTNQPEEAEGKMLRFLQKIGATGWFRTELRGGIKSRRLWRLSPRLEKLYREIVADA